MGNQTAERTVVQHKAGSVPRKHVGRVHAEGSQAAADSIRPRRR